MNPNTPIIVGVAHVAQRVTDPVAGKEATDLMVEAVENAASDAGSPAMLSLVNSVRVVRGAWRYKQPAGYVAEKIGSPGAEKVGTCYGGNMVQSAVSASAIDIATGVHDVIVLTGAEIGNSQAKALKAGVELPYTPVGGPYDRMLGKEEPMSCDAEKNRKILSPIQMYPIFENALRYARKESVEEHITRVSELWAGFSKVAGDNPDAWIRDPLNAETIRTSGPGNRMVSFPYPKLMNSNNAVDMSAAIIMCSIQKAQSLGIPVNKWVYPWTGTDAHDTYFVSGRQNLHSSPAIRVAGKRALDLAGMDVDDVDLVDVYSCFPSAVQVAANELGLSHDRPLTVTGGLTFGGGPLNNYVMHSIVRLVRLLREAPGDKGFITANGGYLTKHAFGVYSTEAPSIDFQHEDVQAEVDREPTRGWLDEHQGDATIESYTVMFGANGPEIAHAACLTPDGKRTWANCSESDVIDGMTKEEFCGQSVKIDGAGTMSLR